MKWILLAIGTTIIVVTGVLVFVNTEKKKHQKQSSITSLNISYKNSNT